MATFTVRPEGIIRQPALTMPGNATGSEAACTSLTASQIRTLLSLGTTSDVTFDIVRATTSVITPVITLSSAFSGSLIGNQPSVGLEGVSVRNAANSAYGSLNAAEVGLLHGATTNSSAGCLDSGLSAYRIMLNRGDTGIISTISTGGMNWYPLATNLFPQTTPDLGVFRTSAGVGELTSGTRVSSGGTLGTLNVATVDRPTAALTLGNSTYGVTVPGQMLVNEGQKLGWRYASGDIGPYQYLMANGAANSGEIGVYNGVGSGASQTVLRVYKYSGGYTAAVDFKNNGNVLIGTTTDDGTSKLQVAGAATFSGDISMQKTSAQGYVRAYSPNGSNNGSFYCDNTGDTHLYSNTNWLGLGSQTGVNFFYKAGIQQEVRFYSPDATKFSGISTTNAGLTSLSLSTSGNIATTSNAAGRIDFSSSYMAINPGSGWMYAYRAGVNSRFETYDSTGTKYTQLTHDGTNGILSTSSGNLNLTPAGGTVVVTGGITASGVVSHGAYTVATLPAAGSNAGKMAQVTDSNVAASGNYGATVAAGGANRVKVFSDGTNWVIA